MFTRGRRKLGHLADHAVAAILVWPGHRRRASKRHQGRNEPEEYDEKESRHCSSTSITLLPLLP
jgi:hypothetical protein